MASKTSTFLVGADNDVGQRFEQALRMRGNPAAKAALRDLGDIPALRKALKGFHTVYYLFRSQDAWPMTGMNELEFIRNLAHACAANKVRKIVYLGDLGKSHKAGEIFMASAVPVLEFRSSLIIGSGCRRYEWLSALAERMPVILAPRWMQTLSQPIALEDVMEYLLEAMRYRGPSRVFEIGGPERVSHRELIKEYARQRKLRRWIVGAPGEWLWLSRLWAKRLLNIDARQARHLMQHLRAKSVLSHADASRVFPVRPRSSDAAIAQAIQDSGNRSSVS